MAIGPVPFRQPHPAATGLGLDLARGTLPAGGHEPAARSGVIYEDLARMRDEGTLFDVDIVCMDDGARVYPAHRALLVARSPVFKAMFLANMREQHSGRVSIEDASSGAVHCFLDFCYMDECPSLSEGVVIDVLKLAHRYDVSALRDVCLGFIAQNSRTDNVVDFMLACENYGMQDFKQLLLMALVDNASALHECLHSDALDDHPELMKQLLAVCSHRLNRVPKGTIKARRFDGLPYRSHCHLCTKQLLVMTKQMLGEMLHPKVQRIRPEHANKITGMILELDRGELIPLLESEETLRAKVEEALRVLRESETPPPGQWLEAHQDDDFLG